jgi:hypothetical protein
MVERPVRKRSKGNCVQDIAIREDGIGPVICTAHVLLSLPTQAFAEIPVEEVERHLEFLVGIVPDPALRSAALPDQDPGPRVDQDRLRASPGL